MKTSKDSAIKVCVCVSPLANHENEIENNVIVCNEDLEVRVTMGKGKGQKSYEVDFPPLYFGNDSTETNSSITQICECVGKVAFNNAFTGYNTSIFTYGAKSTGKSTVMFGTRNEDGIICSVIKGLFERAGKYDEETSFRCEICFFEICADLITDLISKRSNVKSLDGTGKLKVREDPVKGTYVDKLSRHIVTDVDDAEKLYEKGVKNRNRMAALDPSSKGTSHIIFSVTFTMACLNDGLPRELISKINIIDLASEDGYSGHINGLDMDISLLNETEPDEEKAGPLETLNDVIKELAGQNYNSINPVKSYLNMNDTVQKIPYQDSNLTWLMKDAMGGNSETIMICCISPSDKNLRETLSTLKYGNLARHIINKPVINEDQNVKLIRELKDEIDSLKSTNHNTSKSSKEKDLKKIQRDQELMNRLTGIWETKWSKAQQLIEDKSLDVKDMGGAGLKLETKEPHFVSLGGGRLSVGVSIIPISKGFTCVGSGGEGTQVDLLVKGKGIASVHCMIEYDGDAVVLHPKNELVSVDGLPLAEPTRLPQGCMVCIGRSNYFRFNHPREAAMIREQCQSSRFSIVPDDIYPDVQLAIEQRRKEMLEKERLAGENKRLLAMEQQYVQSLDRLALERDQLQHEKNKVQILQQQQQNVASQFDLKMSIQIEELKIQQEELKSFHVKKDRLVEKERDIEEASAKLEQERLSKEERQKEERERLIVRQASLNSANDCESPMFEEEKHQLAMLELDLLTNDFEYHDQFQLQKEEIENEKKRLEEMEEKHKHLVENLSAEILRLQKEREEELVKIEGEKERLRVLEVEQSDAIKTIEFEREKLVLARNSEKIKLEEERDKFEVNEVERMRILQRAVDEQEQERELITREKMRLIDLEEEHKQALEELQQDMFSQQEKMERERKLEMEYIEAEQLMLEELEQKQFESARQIEHETQVIRSEMEKEERDKLQRMEATERYINEMRRQQEMTLRQAEEERRKMQMKREEEQRELQAERENLTRMEMEYKEFSRRLQAEKEQLQREKEEEVARLKEDINSQSSSTASSPLSPAKLFNHDFDPNLLLRKRTPEGKMQQIEEERLRLTELKRQAAEKAELEWNSKKREIERRELEEREIENKKELLEMLKLEQQMKADEERKTIMEETKKMKRQEELLTQREVELVELHKERERREQLEKLLLDEKEHEDLLERSLSKEKERLNTLEKNFAEERSKRVEIEKRLHEEEERNRNMMLEKKKLSPDTISTHMSTNGTLKRHSPSYTLSLRSGHSANHEEINLLQHIVGAGHLVDNCPAVKVNRYSCRGYLLKMGQRFTLAWKRRWFVFDRKLRALCYYQDERKTKSKGILYFQSIQEVYVDSGVKRSPNPKTTFCIRTPQRTFVLNAPTPTAMSIWLDVIFTGREGALMSMTL